LASAFPRELTTLTSGADVMMIGEAIMIGEPLRMIARHLDDAAIGERAAVTLAGPALTLSGKRVQPHNLLIWRGWTKRIMHGLRLGRLTAPACNHRVVVSAGG